MLHLMLQLVIQMISAFTKPIFYRYLYTSWGIKLPILIFWESASAFLGNLLLAVITERKDKWRLLALKDIKYSLLFLLFGGAFSQNVYAWSLACASPKLATMVSLTIPAMIYVLNVIIRKEKLTRSIWCGMKVGSMFAVAAISVILYFLNKGSLAVDSKSYTLDVIAGTLFCFISSSIWLWCSNNIEEAFVEKLAYTYTLAALTSLPGAVGSMIFAVSLYHDKEYYNLAADSIILRVSIAFIVLLSLATTFATRWSVQEKGAAYVASFSTVPLFLDSFAAPLFLHGGNIQPGSVISCLLLPVPLGLFFWANKKEKAAAAAAADDDLERGTNQKEMQRAIIPTGKEQVVDANVEDDTTTAEEPRYICCFLLLLLVVMLLVMITCIAEASMESDEDQGTERRI